MTRLDTQRVIALPRARRRLVFDDYKHHDLTTPQSHSIMSRKRHLTDSNCVRNLFGPVPKIPKQSSAPAALLFNYFGFHVATDVPEFFSRPIHIKPYFQPSTSAQSSNTSCSTVKPSMISVATIGLPPVKSTATLPLPKLKLSINGGAFNSAVEQVYDENNNVIGNSPSIASSPTQSFDTPSPRQTGAVPVIDLPTPPVLNVNGCAGPCRFCRRVNRDEDNSGEPPAQVPVPLERANVEVLFTTPLKTRRIF